MSREMPAELDAASALAESIAILRALAEGQRERANGVGDGFAAQQWHGEAEALDAAADALSGRTSAVRPYFLSRAASDAVVLRIVSLRTGALNRSPRSGGAS